VNVLQLRRLDELNFYPEHALGEKISIEKPAVEPELGEFVGSLERHLKSQHKTNYI